MRFMSVVRYTMYVCTYFFYSKVVSRRFWEVLSYELIHTHKSLFGALKLSKIKPVAYFSILKLAENLD